MMRISKIQKIGAFALLASIIGLGGCFKISKNAYMVDLNSKSICPLENGRIYNIVTEKGGKPFINGQIGAKLDKDGYCMLNHAKGLSFETSKIIMEYYKTGFKSINNNGTFSIISPSNFGEYYQIIMVKKLPNGNLNFYMDCNNSTNKQNAKNAGLSIDGGHCVIGDHYKLSTIADNLGNYKSSFTLVPIAQ